MAVGNGAFSLRELSSIRKHCRVAKNFFSRRKAMIPAMVPSSGTVAGGRLRWSDPIVSAVVEEEEEEFEEEEEEDDEEEVDDDEAEEEEDVDNNDDGNRDDDEDDLSWDMATRCFPSISGLE